MSLRQIVVDTETTGINVEDGHRVIEIGCVELIDRKLTGKNFHYYLNPNREVEAGALAVHGITNEFLKNKPLFSDVANELLEFINNAELIIHNAPFDLSFLNYEFSNSKSNWTTLTDYCRVFDTLPLARQLHTGQRNSLDALCKRYSIDHSQREWHGALLDANLLAHVYLAMTGGQGSFFDTLNDNIKTESATEVINLTNNKDKHDIVVRMVTTAEEQAHQDYLSAMQKQGACLWLEE